MYRLSRTLQTSKGLANEEESCNHVLVRCLFCKLNEQILTRLLQETSSALLKDDQEFLVFDVGWGELERAVNRVHVEVAGVVFDVVDPASEFRFEVSSASTVEQVVV